jgi:DNA-binding GntR family transcriptional regulator
MATRTLKNLTEYVTNYISNKIITLEMKPGERILETAIAEELGLSRGPIRDSLKILEKYWLVELLPRRGARVTEITEKYINNIFDVLIELYSIFTRK